MSNTSLTSKVTQSRGWTLGLGIAAAALAAILLIAYLVQYRSSVNASTEPTPVLVAKGLIPKGTSGTVIAEKGLFQAATLPKIAHHATKRRTDTWIWSSRARWRS